MLAWLTSDECRSCADFAHDIMSESEKNANLFAFDERRYY